MQQPTGFRGLATKPLGRIIAIVSAIVAVALATTYNLGAIVVIAVLLLFGLAMPIYMGWKRPRGLALAGLVILLVAAPITAVLTTQLTISSPPGPVNSFGEYGGDVLQGAAIDHYHADSAQDFHFTVLVDPQYLGSNTSLLNLTLFVTPCADAVDQAQASSVCSTGLSYYQQVYSFNGTPATSVSVTFTQHISGPNIWYWMIYATTSNTSNKTNPIQDIYLNSQNPYTTDIQGPIVGSFLGILGIVIIPAYLDVIIYPGLAFYGALAFYAWFKAREARKKAEWGQRPPPTSSGASAPSPQGSPSSSTSATPAATPRERHCPKCGAVVYANESQCWKCGTALTGSEQPLESAGPPAA
ncbi:MAG TPA: hypothetical protein VGV89_02060 [Thermoplasmata archaeon]|nr:hypothetical protein [Thermoplasmata archaeon]